MRGAEGVEDWGAGGGYLEKSSVYLIPPQAFNSTPQLTAMQNAILVPDGHYHCISLGAMCAMPSDHPKDELNTGLARPLAKWQINTFMRLFFKKCPFRGDNRCLLTFIGVY